MSHVGQSTYAEFSTEICDNFYKFHTQVDVYIRAKSASQSQIYKYSQLESRNN